MTPDNRRELPLFPLHTVLFPGGRLPLQIFEPRYLDMIGACLRDDSPFVVVLIRKGNEVVRARHETPPVLHDVGSLARVADWDSPGPGKLRVVASGTQRVRIERVRQADNHQLIGEVELLDVGDTPLDGSHPELVEILNTLMVHPLIQRLGLEEDSETLGCDRLSCLIAQYLPIDEDHKQELLSLDDARERLDAIAGLIRKMQE